MEEICNALSCRFVMLCGYLAEMVYSAVDIGIPVSISVYDSIQDRLRFLRSGRIIKID